MSWSSSTLFEAGALKSIFGVSTAGWYNTWYSSKGSAFSYSCPAGSRLSGLSLSRCTLPQLYSWSTGAYANQPAAVFCRFQFVCTGSCPVPKPTPKPASSG